MYSFITCSLYNKVVWRISYWAVQAYGQDSIPTLLLLLLLLLCLSLVVPIKCIPFFEINRLHVPSYLQLIALLLSVFYHYQA